MKDVEAVRDNAVRAIVPAIFLGSLVFVVILYLNANYPYLLEDLKGAIGQQPAIASVDQYNSKQQERDRINKINALLISDVNKRDLREGRPFWGAAPHMIELAMATAADSAVIRTEGDTLYEFHIFSFEGNALENNTVVFEFQNNKLGCAHYARDNQSTCMTNKRSYYSATGFPFTAMMAQN